MPLYEYKCEECGHIFEKLIFHEEGSVQCPKCLGHVHKIMSSFNLDIPDEICGKLPKGVERELCTECKQGGSACPLAA